MILSFPVLARTITLTIILMLPGCGGAPDGVDPVDGFELPRYLGTWYEIARLDHSFERGLSQVTAEYSMRSDGGVRVVNRGFRDATSEWDEAVGKAYFTGDSNIGQLKVSFFGPFYGGYNIVELDKVAYQYSLVAGPDRDYLWILSRTPQMDPATLQQLVDKAARLGFATDELIFVDQTRSR
jgi:apolipoprotein D and lipocalin family protein